MALYLGSEKIAGNCSSVKESLLSQEFTISTVTSDGSTTNKELLKDISNFELIVVIARGDKNSLLSIVIPKDFYGRNFNINIVNPSNSNYFVRGHVRVENNFVKAMLTGKNGWNEIGFEKVIGVKL